MDTYFDVIEYIIGFIMLLIREKALKATEMMLWEKDCDDQGPYSIRIARGVQQIKKTATNDPNMMTTCDK